MPIAEPLLDHVDVVRARSHVQANASHCPFHSITARLLAAKAFRGAIVSQAADS